MLSKQFRTGILLLAAAFFLIPPSLPFAETKKESFIKKEAKKVRQGDYTPDDIERWERWLQEAASKKKRPQVALCNNVLGVLHLFEGDPEKARSYLETAVELDTRYNQKKELTRDYFWLAAALRNMGLFAEAQSSVLRSIELARQGGEASMEGKGNLMLADILKIRGKYADAAGKLEQVLYVAEATNDDGLKAACLKDLGNIYSKQGSLDKAERYLQQALQLALAQDPQGKTVAAILSGLGDNCARRKEYDCAVSSYEKSLKIIENQKTKKGLIKLVYKLGIARLKTADAEQGIRDLTRAYEMALAGGMPGIVAAIAKTTAQVLGRKEDWNGALAKTDEAISIFTRIDLPSELQECYHMKGVFLEKTGAFQEAEDNYKKSVALLEDIREDLAGGEEDISAYMEKQGNVYQHLIALLLKQGRTGEALDYIERSRMKKLRDQFDILNPVLQVKGADKARERENEIREQIAAARVELSEEHEKPGEEKNTKKIAQLEKTLGEKKQEYIEYINDLRETFPDMASLLAIQPDNLVDLQGLLPDNVAILQYLIMDDQVYIFLVTATSLIYRSKPVERAYLEEKIDYLRSLVMNPQIALTVGPLEARTLKPMDPGKQEFQKLFIQPFMEASAELYQLLIEPIAAESAGYETLGIIPNGKLHLLPFQALGKPDGNGEFHFLLEEQAIFYLNSQSILKFAGKQARSIGDSSRLVAFGNPDNSLRYAEAEVTMIQGIFSDTAAYVQEDASEDRIKTGIDGFNILHLATHGKMSGNIKESFILLAGSPDGREDGQLYLREIWGLPLAGFQLVTLSACETALGREASGDIMVSLETAFLRAGTPAILATLWEVDDQATGIMMQAFYRKLTRQGKARALREAQLALMNDNRFAYPFFWAPFILVGDWR